MDKKIIIGLVIVFIILGVLVLLLIKNNKTNNSNKKIIEIKENQNLIVENDKKEDTTKINASSLVLYFSATGNTKEVAKHIQSASNSNIIEIKPKKEYTSADLSYNNDNCRANKEQNDKDARPEIENISDIDKYDVIFLGYPIWWGDVPKVILTLLDSYNFNNKTIIPFCTSGSSSISQSMNTLKGYNKNVNWIEGKRFSSSVSEQDIREWIDSLNINNKKEENKMYIKINNETFAVTLENNSSVEALIKKLQQSDITIGMHDYSNFEKVGELGFSLPRNDTNITTTAGDIILYQGNQITIYYDTNNWNFTKLGHIDNITQNKLKEILGDNDVTVTLSLEK